MTKNSRQREKLLTKKEKMVAGKNGIVRKLSLRSKENVNIILLKKVEEYLAVGL